jgi:hypothetical protein
MPIPEINLDLGATVQQPFAPSSAGSTPNRDKGKYPMDDIRDPTPCTLMYVKGRTSRTIKVAEATMMPSRKLHGQPIPTECEAVEVTMIREGREFEDLDYPDEDEGIEKLVDAKGTFILQPRKDITVKTRSTRIILPWSTDAGALLLQTCRSLLKTNIHQRQHLLLKTVKTQSSRRAQGEGRLLLLETLKAQSSRTTMSVGHFLLLLETLKAQSSRTTMSIGHLLLLLDTLKAQSSRTTVSVGHLLLLPKSQSSRTPRGKGWLLLLLKTKSSMTPR